MSSTEGDNTFLGITPPEPVYVPPPVPFEEQPIKEVRVPETPPPVVFDKATMEFLPTEPGGLPVVWDKDLSMLEPGRHQLNRKVGDAATRVDVDITRKLDTIEISYTHNGELYHHLIKANGRIYSTVSDPLTGRQGDQSKSMWRRY